MNLERMAARLDALKQGLAAQQAAQHTEDDEYRALVLERLARYTPEEQDEIWIRIYEKYISRGDDQARKEFHQDLDSLSDGQLARLEAFVIETKASLSDES